MLRRIAAAVGTGLSQLLGAGHEGSSEQESPRLVIFDDCYPSPLSGFRLAEFNRLLEVIGQAEG
jgi:hypothetical protein